jgi:hypothetical protein
VYPVGSLNDVAAALDDNVWSTSDSLLDQIFCDGMTGDDPRRPDLTLLLQSHRSGWRSQWEERIQSGTSPGSDRESSERSSRGWEPRGLGT